MRIAETSQTRTLLTLSTVGAVALIATAWATASVPVADPVREPARAWRGCGQPHRAVPKPTPAPTPRAHGSTNAYYDTLFGARDKLTACMTADDVGVKLVLEIGASGRVTNVEVTAKAKDLSHVKLEVVKCLELAVTPLEFPTAPHHVLISTHLFPAHGPNAVE